MRVLAILNRFWRDQRGVSASEFALVLPLLLIMMIGTIDIGLYTWSLNQAEKATQVGARWAVATDMLPSGLATYSFATQGGIPQGTVVPASAFPGVTCTEAGCTCDGSCSFDTSMDQNAFGSLVGRMQDIKSDIAASDVTVTYGYSGLGFSGDPNGPDVAPIVTVSLDGLDYQPITFVMFDQTLDLPSYSYSLTAEDSEGSVSN
uniref:TadE/TadG family type IV pilus assembly protein n=1 Tax=uncultured Erythrobacter sp. TaxID=263913 RepID=UPI0026290589|nr:TadE/TadG family type IV pilus assembly protein [uncultured Erythrobacter sp.]